MNADIALLCVAIGGYLLGSIPFGLLLTRAAGLGDIRNIGSGNIGATNVLRTGRKDLAFTTLILDGLKGAAAILIARALAFPEELALMAGGCAVLGHNFPIWLWFKGGKGMATTLGALIVADWRIGICACVLWLITAVLFRYSSLSSLLATAAAPLVALGFGRPEVALLAAFMAVLVWLRHRENIARLLKGQEPKIGQKKN